MSYVLQDQRRRWVALAVVCMGQLMMVLDATIVNVALPAIQTDLRFSPGNLTWVIDAYMVAFGSLLLLAGRIGDLVGRKRVFLSGLALFTAASISCGLAQDQLTLIIARFVQGAGGAVASAVILAILVTEFREARERAIAMSVYTFVVSSGGSIGLLAGGALTQALDWHWIFFINVPIGVLTFVLGRILIAETPGLGFGESVDWLGSVLVTVATMTGIYAIVTAAEHGWGSAHTLGFGAASLAMLAGFGVLESRLRNPIFPPRILRSRGLVGTSVVRGFLVTGMFSTFLLGALYLERVRGFGALETGLAFLPMTIVMGAMSLGPAASLMRRFGPLRMLLGGLALITLALLGLTQLGDTTPYFPGVVVPFVLLGLGAGSAFLPLMTLAMADVPARDSGLASGIVNASLQIGAAIGLAALGTIAATRTATLRDGGAGFASALTGGYTLAWTIGAISVAAGAVAALALLRTPRDPERVAVPEAVEAA
jgi:EmrB/QacA subfamily drug resistance transporter